MVRRLSNPTSRPTRTTSQASTAADELPRLFAMNSFSPPTTTRRSFQLNKLNTRHADNNGHNDRLAVVAAIKLLARNFYFGALNFKTFCVCVPSFSMPRVITSPGLRNTGLGFLPRPTPGGVPVVITSPGSSVMSVEQ